MVDYRITEGSDFQWQCFGANAYKLDSWLFEQNGASFSIVFDRKDQTTYQMEIHDYKNNRAYRWTAASWSEAYQQEARDRNVPADQAWDDVDYVDLESLDDFWQKGRAVFLGQDYDTRVSIPLDLPEDELMVLFKAAHDRDMTFNAFVEEALKQALEDFKNDPEGTRLRFEKWKNK